jgi:hypothetical protein
VLLESVKDHLIPHIAEKTSTKDMYDALVGIYTRMGILAGSCICSTNFRFSG